MWGGNWGGNVFAFGRKLFDVLSETLRRLAVNSLALRGNVLAFGGLRDFDGGLGRVGRRGGGEFF